MLSCNRRYLQYLSSLNDFSAGIRALERPTQPRPVKGHNLKGLNFLSRPEQTLLAALQRPGFISLVSAVPTWCRSSANSLPPPYPDNSPVCAHLGVIKRVLGTYRYYLTRFGRAAIAAGRRLTEHTIIPALA